MIFEANPYRVKLLKTAGWLRKGVRHGESSLFKLEHEVIVGFYYIRKLLEAQKTSPTVKNMRHSIEWHPVLAEINLLNWLNIKAFIDPAITNTTALNLNKVCNTFIHSFVLAPIVSGRYVDALLVASDLDKAHRVYRIPLLLIAELFELVANDESATAVWTKDSRGRVRRAAISTETPSPVIGQAATGAAHRQKCSRPAQADSE